MTQRRRFFPAAPVQGAPGRTVEMEVLLKAAPQAPVAVDLFGAGWLSAVFTEYGEWAWEQQPDGRWRVTNPHMDAFFVGTPAPAMIGSQPIPGPDLICAELELNASTQARLHFGVVQGVSMANVRWVATWDQPSATDPAESAVGHRFSTWGNVIAVYQYPDGAGMSATETLTATAYCAGEVVGACILRIIHEAY